MRVKQTETPTAISSSCDWSSRCCRLNAMNCGDCGFLRHVGYSIMLPPCCRKNSSVTCSEYFSFTDRSRMYLCSKMRRFSAARSSLPLLVLLLPPLLPESKISNLIFLRSGLLMLLAAVADADRRKFWLLLLQLLSAIANDIRGCCETATG